MSLLNQVFHRDSVHIEETQKIAGLAHWSGGFTSDIVYSPTRTPCTTPTPSTGEPTSFNFAAPPPLLSHQGFDALRLLQLAEAAAWRPTSFGFGTAKICQDDPMRVSDLKRAVEDVVLRPDDNRIADIQKRGTIAALDLCQLDSSNGQNREDHQISASAMNACSCSSEVVGTTQSPAVAADSSRPTLPLCASSSLDAIVCRPQPVRYSSTSGSRRHSRVYPNLHSKRKRSNSLTNYNKGQSLSVSLPASSRHTPNRFVNEDVAFRSSLASSDSHSSVARSDDYTNGYVLEEDESAIGVTHEPPSLLHSNHSTCSSSSSSNAFTTFRQPRNDVFDDDMMDCD